MFWHYFICSIMRLFQLSFSLQKHMTQKRFQDSLCCASQPNVLFLDYFSSLDIILWCPSYQRINQIYSFTSFRCTFTASRVLFYYNNYIQHYQLYLAVVQDRHGSQWRQHCTWLKLSQRMWSQKKMYFYQQYSPCSQTYHHILKSLKLRSSWLVSLDTKPYSSFNFAARSSSVTRGFYFVLGIL